MSPENTVLGRGQVFLAHGRIETIVHDVAVIPTDAYFSVREYWSPLVGEPRVAAKPRSWPTVFGQSATSDNVWFIDVGDVIHGGISLLTRRTTELLTTIAHTHTEVHKSRTKLRVAMPVLAVAGGGMSERKGDVVRSLMESLVAATRSLNIDVVVVTPNRSVFSAVQTFRRDLNPWQLNQSDLEQAQRLGHLAAHGQLALFLGAGVSVPAGLPTWSELLTELNQSGDNSVDELTKLSALDQAQVLEMRVPQLGNRIADITKRARRPSLAHALLAGLGCAEAITTNYDDLYETAANASRQPVMSVLPWSPARPGHPWVLKMHGDASHPETIVLTRRQFVRYDAETRPAGSLLQSLLLTRHLLVVGASLNDDNVSRLTYEVDEFRRKNGLTGTFATFLDVDGVPARKELWSGQLDWLSFSGSSIQERVRNLEIMLDAVAAFATTDASWLLDARFEGLLSEPEQDVAREARQLQARAAQLGPRFAPLGKALLSLGAICPRSADAGATRNANVGFAQVSDLPDLA